jgi:hypothetical protein
MTVRRQKRICKKNRWKKNCKEKLKKDCKEKLKKDCKEKPNKEKYNSNKSKKN